MFGVPLARMLNDADAPGLPVPWLMYTPDNRPASAVDKLADGNSSMASAFTLVILPVILPFFGYHIQLQPLRLAFQHLLST